MKRLLLSLGILGIWACVGLQSAQAQIGSYQRPQVGPSPYNPYLNMIRYNTAVNYYGIVRPQISTAQGLQSLQQQINQNQTGLTPLGTNDQLQQEANIGIITGHAATFMNTSHYYPVPGGRFAPGSGGTSTSSNFGRTIGNTQTPMGYSRVLR